MRAATWNETGSLDVGEQETPEPRPGSARIRVAASGICGTDLHFFRGSFPPQAGTLPGHEVAGIIDAAGEGEDLEPGTPVAVEPLTGCGACDLCRSGTPNRCRKRRLYGIQERGGMAEYVVVPATCLHPLPADLDTGLAALAEPVAVCVRGVRLGRVSLGDSVAVLGAGTIGLLSIVVARAAGASAVHITARHPEQARLAETLGATAVHSDARALSAALARGADVVIETVGGSAETLREAVRIARPGATIAMLGVFDGSPALPGLEFSNKELTLVGSNCYGYDSARGDFPSAIELLGREAAVLAPLVTHRFPLNRINDAFATAADKSTGSIKVHVEP